MTQLRISKLARVSCLTSLRNLATAALKWPATNCDAIAAVFLCGITKSDDSASVRIGARDAAEQTTVAKRRQSEPPRRGALPISTTWFRPGDGTGGYGT